MHRSCNGSRVLLRPLYACMAHYFRCSDFYTASISVPTVYGKCCLQQRNILSLQSSQHVGRQRRGFCLKVKLNQTSLVVLVYEYELQLRHAIDPNKTSVSVRPIFADVIILLFILTRWYLESPFVSRLNNCHFLSDTLSGYRRYFTCHR